MKRKQERTAYLFLLPSLLGTVVFVLFPFLDVIRRSFLQATGSGFVGLDNYREVFQNEAFQRAVCNTGRFLLFCIPLLLLLSFVLAVWIYHLPWGKKTLESIFLIPMAIPVASIVVFWKLTFHENGGLNEILEFFGMQGKDWMNTGAAFGVLVFTYIWKNLGYDIVLWIAGLAAIPSEQYEAAKTDGASRFQSFFYLTLPQMRTSLVMIGVLSFIHAFRVFREAYLIAGDYPHESIYMLQHLFNNWFVKLDMQKMSAAAVLMVVCIGCLLFAVEWWNEREDKA